MFTDGNYTIHYHAYHSNVQIWKLCVVNYKPPQARYISKCFNYLSIICDAYQTFEMTNIAENFEIHTRTDLINDKPFKAV